MMNASHLEVVCILRPPKIPETRVFSRDGVEYLGLTGAFGE